MNKKSAMTLVDNIIQNESEKKDLVYHILKMFFWTSNYKAGLIQIERTLKNQNNILLMTWVGVMSFFSQEYNKALTAFKKAAKISKKSEMEFKYLLGETHYANLELGNAEIQYRFLLNSSKYKPFALYRIGCCRFKKDQYDEAYNFFMRALKKNITKQKSDALNKAGICLIFLNMLKEAKLIFEDCLKLYPRDLNTQLNLALTLGKLGEFNKAINLYANILHKQPYNVIAINNLAHNLAAINKYDEAIKYCNIGIEIDPINYDLLTNKGYCLYKQGKFTSALECFKQAEKILRNDALLQNNKALCFMALGRYNDAIKVFNNLSFREYTEDIWLNKAYCLIQKESYQDAIASLNNINIEDSKRRDHIYKLKGICFERIGEYKKAVEFYNKYLNTA